MTARPTPLRARHPPQRARASPSPRQVADALTAADRRRVELVEITTYGDVARGALAQIGGTGVFVSALRDALLAGEIDLAVHSLKDLPTAPADGLVVAAVPRRERPARRPGRPRRPRRSAELPAGRAGRHRLAAARRAAARARPRPRRRRRSAATSTPGCALVADGELDAVVLARAGLARLGRLDEVTEVLDPSTCSPRPGRARWRSSAAPATPVDRRAVAAARRPRDPGRRHRRARRCSPPSRPAAPRPSGALASRRRADGGTELHLRAVVAAVDGSAHASALSATAPLGERSSPRSRLAADLLAEGAAASDRRSPPGAPGGDRLVSPTAEEARVRVGRLRRRRPR